MKDDTFCVLASLLLGILGICSFFGFDILVFLSETIMHSVQQRCPDCIVKFAGYYGQCLLYIVYTFGNLIAPVVLHKLGTKRTLFVAVFCFAIYSSNFILIRNYIYFPACAFAGFGTALFFCSTGAYISKHSTEKTLSRNQALSFMLMGSSMLVSGNFMIISSEISKEPQQENLTQSEDGAAYRDFSDKEIHVLNIGMMTMSVVALILCVLMPGRQIKGSLQKRSSDATSISHQFQLIFQGLKTPGMIKLVPLYFFCGMFTAFMNSIYTTSVSFTHSLAGYTNLIAFVCMSVSAGELIVGLTMGYLSKRYRDFGLLPAMASTCGSFTIYATLVVLFTPPEASMKPTIDESFLSPRLYMCLIIGVICGIVDGSMNNVRVVASAVALPKQPTIAFSISKFYQASASAFFYYLSSILTIYWLMGILFATLIASLFMFFWFLRDLRLERERLEELGEEKEKEKENENEKEKEKENEEEKENEKEKHFDKPIEN